MRTFLPLRRTGGVIAALALGAASCGVRADDKAVPITVDFGKIAGVIRPLHGINMGPLTGGGLIDLTAAQRALGVPWTRLHDCHWPNPDVVDVHAIFPVFNADPSRPESYDFARTDDYLEGVRATGARIVYRLGESIEHEKTKRFVQPPRDAAKWAAICCGIIAHYNDGWAKGFHHGITHWEIWNEPENRPAMWTGTDEEYFALYAITARAIKTRWPGLKVGGPAVGNSGEFMDGRFRPSAFVRDFLDFCRREALPLDFFSWHCYTDDPHELSARARGLRALLDEHGFRAAESHLNEWNFLPEKSWDGISRKATPEARQRFAEAMSGPRAAAFIASALIELQEAPVDVANLFHGATGIFGLFNEHGVPTKNYHAMLAFRALADAGARVKLIGELPKDLALAATVAERTGAVILASNYGARAAALQLDISHLPWNGATSCEVQLLDATHNLAVVGNASVPRIPVQLPAASVVLVTLRPAAR